MDGREAIAPCKPCSERQEIAEADAVVDPVLGPTAAAAEVDDPDTDRPRVAGSKPSIGRRKHRLADGSLVKIFVGLIEKICRASKAVDHPCEGFRRLARCEGLSRGGLAFGSVR